MNVPKVVTLNVVHSYCKVTFGLFFAIASIQFSFDKYYKCTEPSYCENYVHRMCSVVGIGIILSAESQYSFGDTIALGAVIGTLCDQAALSNSSLLNKRL
jgi:hypothetical protein